jgi:hypothetical protein
MAEKAADVVVDSGNSRISSDRVSEKNPRVYVLAQDQDDAALNDGVPHEPTATTELLISTALCCDRVFSGDESNQSHKACMAKAKFGCQSCGLVQVHDSAFQHSEVIG